MSTNKTITINGRIYDAVTGLPVKAAKPAAKVTARPTTASKPVAPVKAATAQASNSSVHDRTQRSQTLHRRAVKKPTPATKPHTGRHMDIARSPRVSRFAPHPVTRPNTTARPTTSTAKATPDKQPQVHPLVQRTLARLTPAPVVKPATPKEVKEAALNKALAAPRVKPAKQRTPLAPWKRRLLITLGCLLVLVGAGFAVYYFVPSVSVSIASSQAGVRASYPKYVPDGYHLSQPVRYKDGEVTLAFNSNSSGNGYTITQTRSSWDSSAVLDNVVRTAAGENYITTKERGLTIYSYNQSAAWVSGGVLYVIDSNAPLSGEQIRHIATSL